MTGNVMRTVNISSWMSGSVMCSTVVFHLKYVGKCFVDKKTSSYTCRHSTAWRTGKYWKVSLSLVASAETTKLDSGVVSVML